MLRSTLIRIRREYNTNFKRLMQVAIGVFLLSLVAAFAIDYFLPFTGMWNVLRSLVLVPLAASIFALGYSYSIFLHRQRVATDPDWVPFRMRFSPRWRRNISAIIAAVIFVLIYGAGYSVAYTFLSSVFVALIFSLFVFMRSTHEEGVREKLGVPDTRDLQYDNYKKKLQEARAKAQAEKRSKKKKDEEDDDED